MKHVVVIATVLFAQLALEGRQNGAPAATNPSSSFPRLLEVSFSGGRDIKRDDDSGTYSAPHWRDAPGLQYPYLVQAGKTLTIANAKVRVFPAITGTPLVRGTREDVVSIPPTQSSRVSATADVYEISNVATGAPFPSNRTAFYPAFDIRWEVSLDNGRTWESAGTSSNPIYVCLSDTAAAAILFRTVVHLACSN